MKVYLIQHGESLTEEVDPTRPLSEKGQKDSVKIAELLKKLEIKVSVIYESGKKRATQTAEIINSKISSLKGIIQRNGLAPNDPVSPWVGELHNKGEEDIIIVGHLPFLSRLTSRLLNKKEEEEIVAFTPGGVVCLERFKDKQWWIRWMVLPELF
ncbi:MAG: phosphohistidine phosphatase SixA [Desulfobacterota bacterium]|nr:phosphohistidine phosphatase SixA [Thermodesulfobacteriota bacterium]